MFLRRLFHVALEQGQKLPDRLGKHGQDLPISTWVGSWKSKGPAKRNEGSRQFVLMGWPAELRERPLGQHVFRTVCVLLGVDQQ